MMILLQVFICSALLVLFVTGAPVSNDQNVEIKCLDESRLMSKFLPHLILCLRAINKENESGKREKEKEGEVVWKAKDIKLNNDVFLRIFDYLDGDSAAYLSGCNKNFHSCINENIEYCLDRFIPGLRTDEPILNKILFSFIRSLGILDNNLKDSVSRFDAVEMIIAKFVLKEYPLKKLPKIFYHLMVLFFYGYVFGPDAPVPSTLESVTLNLYRNLQVHDLPKSIKLFKDYYNTEYGFYVIRKKCAELDFVASRPSNEDQLKKYESLNSFPDSNNFSNVALEIFLLENGIHIDRVYSRDCINNYSRNGLFFHKILDQVNRTRLHIFFEPTEAICLNYTVKDVVANSSSLFYIASRTLADPFKYENYVRLPADPHKNLRTPFRMFNQNCYRNLGQFETISTILKSGLLNLDLIQDASNIFYGSLFEFVLTECPTPVNFFNLEQPLSRPRHLSSIGNMIDKGQFFIMLKYIKSKYNGDPLPLMLFDRDFLLEYKSFILESGPFNFKNTYLIDIDDSVEGFRILKDVRWKILTCKELLVILDIQEIFTRDPIEIEYNLDKDPISLNRFIQEAKLIPTKLSMAQIMYSVSEFVIGFLF